MATLKKQNQCLFDYDLDIHFYKLGHWINDPNGLVFINNQYHLFYQMNPDDIVWGNMQWGHAVSTYCLHWEQRPIALSAEPEGLGYIFSGGAVYDKFNTSNLGSEANPPVVLSFTHHDANEVQRQSLAYSIDGMQTFNKYANNPVIENPGIKDFRDPKIIWVKNIDKWVMSVVAGKKVQFYSSSNLLDWELLSEFGEGKGCQDGVWECPDLFPLKSSNSVETKWILLISINPGGPNGGSGMQYFVGDFIDGVFVDSTNDTKWLDYGTDFYAGISWDNLNDKPTRRRIIAWMSNWDYANQLPSKSYKSAMSLPRDISLYSTEKGEDKDYELHMSFCPNVSTLVSNEIKGNIKPNTITFTQLNFAFNLLLSKEDILEDDISIMLSNETEEFLEIIISSTAKQIIVDRNNFIWDDKSFQRTITAPFESSNSKFDLNLIVDSCSIELLVDEGKRSITSLFFPMSRLNQLSIISLANKKLKTKLYELKSIW